MIGIIVGTRPEIIKMSSIITECETMGLEYILIHTGQHYSYNMDKIFFEELELPAPHYLLDVGEKYSTPGAQTGEMIRGIEKILMMEKEALNIILVEGDTNSVLAGAIAAVKLHIRVGHVEAGLRSFDRGMPEEINRILTDHISDLLFAPTEKSKINLLDEGISEENIFVTGNTIVDAVYRNLKIAKKKSRVLKELGLEKGKYIVLTLHRQENVDMQQRFSNIIEASTIMDFQVVFPIHPRAKKMAEKFGLLKKMGMGHLNLIEPVGYLDFLNLLKNAKLVLTDSGGVQEEANILSIPCLTLRDNTERPETIDVGANYLVGTNTNEIAGMVSKILTDAEFEESMRTAKNTFGDGKAGERIVDLLRGKGGALI